MLTYEAAVGHSPVCLKLPVAASEPAEVRDCAKANVFMLKRTRRRGMSRMEMPSLETETQTPPLFSYCSISSETFKHKIQCC